MSICWLSQHFPSTLTQTSVGPVTFAMRRASSIASLSPRRAGRRSWWGWWGPRFVVPVRKIRARWSLRIFLGHGWEIQPTNDGLMIWLLISVMVHYCVPKPQNNCESLEMMAHYCVPRFLGGSFFSFF